MVQGHPEAPRQHVIARRCLARFKDTLPPEWVCHEPDLDYGWDVLVEVVLAGEVRDSFFVQLKGSDNPDYAANGEHVSTLLKVPTVQYLRAKPMPVMVCVCDTGRQDEPLYWVWLHESLTEKQKAALDSTQQATLTIHVPTSQVLTREACEAIGEYVLRWHEDVRAASEISDVITACSSRRAAPFEARERMTVRSSLARERLPLLESGGLFGIVESKDESTEIEIYTDKDHELLENLKTVGHALNARQEAEAENILDRLEAEIEQAPSHLRAKYLNSRGVLAGWRRKYDEARRFLTQAQTLNRDDPQIATNLLWMEFEERSFSETDSAMSTEWETTLENTIRAYPTHKPALRLKAYWLGRTKGPEEARRFLEAENLWSSDPINSRWCIAECHMHRGEFAAAVKVLQETESLGEPLDEMYYSLYGSALMRLGFGSSEDTAILLDRRIDLKFLRQSATVFEKAYTGFLGRGFPSFADSAIHDYAIVLCMLGSPGEAQKVTEIYLERHSDSLRVRAVLADALAQQNKMVAASKQLLAVYEKDPHSSTTFKNLLLCLHGAEDHETLVQIARERQSTGFVDREEEALALEHMARSLAELGDLPNAQSLLERMKSDPALRVSAFIAEAAILRSQGCPPEECRDVYRSALREFPQNLDILTHLAMSLYPPKRENAREIIGCLTAVKERRYLAEAEYHALGTAWLLERNPDRAKRVFEEGYHRYPHDIRFAYLIAQCLLDQRYEDQAFQILEEYTKRAGKHFDVLKQAAILAANTGRLDEAIRFFSWALPKASDSKTRGAIHCQLYQLRKERDDNPKAILGHVVEYGQTVEGDTADEARFLMMWLMSPHIPAEKQDDEVRPWIAEFQRRLADFSQKHPRHRGLMTFKLPEHATPEETRDTFLGQLGSVMLPGMLARVPGELAARCRPFPLVFRAAFAFGAHSIFHYWNQCVSSTDYEHAIHVWNASNDLQKEHEVALRGKRICLDLTALLTLLELDLLQYVANEFQQIVLARGTKVAVDEERLSFLGPHPYAKKIEDWWITHKSRIRVLNRFYEEGSIGDRNQYRLLESGLFLRAEIPISMALSAGVGQSLLLAQHERIPLYSDESAVRAWAFADHATEAFGTLSIIHRLVEQNIISEREEWNLLATMIQKNFRTIPIEPRHLTGRLLEIIKAAENAGQSLPTHKDFGSDGMMSAFLGLFGDTGLNDEWLAGLAVRWWLDLLAMDRFRQYPSLLAECIYSPAFRLSQWSQSGVLKGIPQQEDSRRFAALLALLLFQALRQEPQVVPQAWSAIKSCCEIRFTQNQTAYQNMFQGLIPQSVRILIARASEPHLKKIDWLAHLSSNLPEEDRVWFYFH